MPVALVVLLLDITLIYHASRTGRLQPWAFIILMLPLGGEPAYALGRAQAEFGRNRPAEALATLDDLQKRWPDFESAEAHLLYARSLAEIGRIDEALEEYYALVPYAPGAEARVRYGMLLRMVGRDAEARVVFNELLL